MDSDLEVQQISCIVGAPEAFLSQGALLEKMLISQGKEQVWHVKVYSNMQWHLPLELPSNLLGNPIGKAQNMWELHEASSSMDFFRRTVAALATGKPEEQFMKTMDVFLRS